MTTILYFRSYSNFNASRKLVGVMRVAHEFGWNVQTIDTGRETSDETADLPRRLHRQEPADLRARPHRTPFQSNNRTAGTRKSK